MTKQYQNYYNTHSAYVKDNDKNLFLYYKKNIQTILSAYDKSVKILDIGCGKGSFAKFLHAQGFQNYVGLDLDDGQIEKNKKALPDYTFIYKDGIGFLENTFEKFDIIFISHVVEHLDKHDLYILIKQISEHLTIDGVFVNIMPNAGSLFFSNIGRYADQTHENLYSQDSFSQILLQNGFDRASIFHKNSRPNFFILEILRKIIKSLIKFFVLLLGYPYPSIDTFEIITIVKHN